MTYLYRGSRDLIALNRRIEASRTRRRRPLRGLGDAPGGSCPLPCCPNDSPDDLPCLECRDALGPMLRLAGVACAGSEAA